MNQIETSNSNNTHQTNTNVLGDSPAMSMGKIFHQAGTNTNKLFAQAATAQQQSLASKEMPQNYTMDTSDDAIAIAKLLQAS